MSITIICPNLCCRSVLRVPEQVRGRKVRCGKCGKNFIVPDRGQPEPQQQSAAPQNQKSS